MSDRHANSHDLPEGAPWVGFYINLDRSLSRREAIEAELRRAGIAAAYQRFSAVDGTALGTSGARLSKAEVGCFRSHAAILLKEPPARTFAHVLEDDAILFDQFRPTMLRFMDSGLLDQFDLIYTCILLISPSIYTIRKLKAAYDAARRGNDIAFSLIDLNGLEFYGSNSYFINPRSYGKLKSLMRKELGASGLPGITIDALYLREIRNKRLKAACVFPFVSCLELGLSKDLTIQTHAENMLPHNLMSYAFYAGCDVGEGRAIAAPLLQTTKGDEHMDLLSDIQRALITPVRAEGL